MNADDRKLLTHLFTKATELLEDSIEPTVAGQSGRNSPKTFAGCVRQLRDVAHNLAAIAEAADAILRMSETPPPKRRKSR